MISTTLSKSLSVILRRTPVGCATPTYKAQKQADVNWFQNQYQDHIFNMSGATISLDGLCQALLNTEELIKSPISSEREVWDAYQSFRSDQKLLRLPSVVWVDGSFYLVSDTASCQALAIFISSSIGRIAAKDQLIKIDLYNLADSSWLPKLLK